MIMNYIEPLSEILVDLINHSQLPISAIKNYIEEAKKGVDADYSIICFKFQKFLKLKGPEIAQMLASKFTEEILRDNQFLERVTVSGAYLNFTISKKVMAASLIPEILSDIHNYATSAILEVDINRKIVIEYPSPNTNKPLHFGHVRNMLLGQALVKMHQKIGNQVFETNLLNDRGIHICKSMLAYQKFGNGQTPQKANRKSDHFVGDFYVRFAQEEAKLKKGLEPKFKLLEVEKKKPKKDQNLEIITQIQSEIEKTPYGQFHQELQQMLLDWELKEPQTRSLWRKMNDWAEHGFQETYKLFNINHQKTYYESQIYNQGKEIVFDGLKSGIFEKLDDGAIIVRFKKKGLPKQKVLLRKDGTSLYITQDLHLAFQKYHDFPYDESIYVVGNEQNMQLKVLYEMLSNLGMKATNIHYSYGMISLTTGKMKSREGKIVDADDVVQELQNLAFIEIKERYPKLEEKIIKKRAFKIGMAALRFFILKYEFSRDFVFDPKKSISFEGETGPYVLYSYARICSIFRKAQLENIDVPFNPDTSEVNPKFLNSDPNFSLMQTDDEYALISILSKYPNHLRSAAINRKPHELIRYLFELAQQFTKFYHSCPVLSESSEIRYYRMVLCEAARLVLKDGLNLFEIYELTEM
ncbi:MAG: arginine--tRNA ligase [Promethearchaeota archaeon]